MLRAGGIELGPEPARAYEADALPLRYSAVAPYIAPCHRALIARTSAPNRPLSHPQPRPAGPAVLINCRGNETRDNPPKWKRIQKLGVANLVAPNILFGL